MTRSRHHGVLRSAGSVIATAGALLLTVPGCGPDTRPDPQRAPSARRAPPARRAPASAPRRASTYAAGKALTPRWTLRTKGKHAELIGIRKGVAYLISGDYAELGWPTKWLYAVDAATGKVRWIYDIPRGKVPVTASLVGVGVELSEGQDPSWVTWAGKRQLKPPMPAELDPPVPTVACRRPKPRKMECALLDDAKVLWTRQHVHPLSEPRMFPDGVVCYGEEKTLLLRCAVARTGQERFRVAVPRLPRVKHPDRVAFTFVRDGGRLVVASYDNTVRGYDER